METVRTFIAIELNERVQNELRQVQDSLRDRLSSSAVRWVNPESVHLTLKFLGNIPVTQMAEIMAALQPACAGFNPFEFTLAGLGCFPNLNRPNVIWVGVQGDLETLGRLRGSVERHIAPLGYPTERRSFAPHLTVGRIKTGPPLDTRRIADAIREAQDRVISTLHAEEVSLMRTDLSPRGAKYTRLMAVTLK